MSREDCSCGFVPAGDDHVCRHDKPKSLPYSSLAKDLKVAYEKNRKLLKQLAQQADELNELRRDRIQFGKMARQIAYLKGVLNDLANKNVEQDLLQSYCKTALTEGLNSIK